MKDYFKNYLFTKHILVADEEPKDQFETAVSLSKIYAVKVIKGLELLHPDHMKICEEMIGSKIKVPAPFYKNFPESVKTLTPDQLLFDQLFHYFQTYGLGGFEERHHSIFEADFERLTFTEDFEYKEFEVLSEKDAAIKLSEIIKDLLASTRPVTEEQIQLIVAFMNAYDYCPGKIASKDVALELLFIRRDMRLARFIKLPDVIKLVEKINYYSYGKKKINKLNLKNKDRKFITQVMHEIMDREASISLKTIAECSEKKKAWKGLLHHIHFKPLNESEKNFIDRIRYRSNSSVYSEVEFWMENNNPLRAAQILYVEKGSGAVLRNVEYFISRCTNDDDKRRILKLLHYEKLGGIILMQLYLHYCFYDPKNISPRNFVFTKFNMVKTHTETPTEFKRRKTKLSEDDANLIADRVDELMADHYEDKVKGNVYISPKMATIALPLQETASSTGFGILPKGSRIPIPKDKIIRAFTYWEQVNDIDLSAHAITDKGATREFSWRTMYRRPADYVYYSGDVTDGFYGGSEYFDVDLSAYKKAHPHDRYLVFCNNVYSGKNFSACLCTAGYMVRDKVGSGEVFEPKTVQTSYTINSDSTFAYLFAIDLQENELVWLNISKDSNLRIAGMSEFDWLEPYIYCTKHLNVYDFFHMAAEHITRRPEDADVIVSDTLISGLDTEGKEIIHSYDTEKMLKYINL